MSEVQPPYWEARAKRAEAQVRTLEQEVAELQDDVMREELGICDCCEALSTDLVDAGGHMQCPSCCRVARLEDELAASRRCHVEAESAATRLSAEIEQLQRAILHYGDHDTDCQLGLDPDAGCDCGFDGILPTKGCDHDPMPVWPGGTECAKCGEDTTETEKDSDDYPETSVFQGDYGSHGE